MHIHDCGGPQQLVLQYTRVMLTEVKLKHSPSLPNLLTLIFIFRKFSTANVRFCVNSFSKQ